MAASPPAGCSIRAGAPAGAGAARLLCGAMPGLVPLLSGSAVRRIRTGCRERAASPVRSLSIMPGRSLRQALPSCPDLFHCCPVQPPGEAARGVHRGFRAAAASPVRHVRTPPPSCPDLFRASIRPPGGARPREMPGTSPGMTIWRGDDMGGGYDDMGAGMTRGGPGCGAPVRVPIPPPPSKPGWIRAMRPVRPPRQPVCISSESLVFPMPDRKNKYWS